MKTIIKLILLTPFLLLYGCAKESGPEIPLYALDPGFPGAQIGVIIPVDTPQGLKVYVNGRDLPPGTHGFHVHENPSCADMPGPDGKIVAGLGAGGHFDPENTGEHLGPGGNGHKGDLPALKVDKTGNINMIVLAPQLKLKDIRGHSLVIHAGGDNYSDKPVPLGGGGARIACAVVPRER